MIQITKLRGLSFLVYGLGISGQSVIKFFKKNKIKNFKVWDDKKINLSINNRIKNLSKELNKVDLIVLSPGISLIKNKKLNKYKDKIITDIDLFYLTKNNSKTIVVTGTNGKSTTCKLLAHLLKKNKIKFSLGGNIGNPILNLRSSKSKFVIIEASSFQLSHSKFIVPNYALFLNLTNDHLDWHGTMKNYLKSKLKIFRLQSKNDFALINGNLKKFFVNKHFKSKLIIPNNNYLKNVKYKLKNDYLMSNINSENIGFVYAFSKLIKIKKKNFFSAMRSFKGLPHRFEIFLKKKDVTFINDSKATSFSATESALSGLENIYWILGGLPKKGDKIRLSKIKKKVINCYLIGNNINFFSNQLRKKINFSVTKNLKTSIIKILHDIKLQNRKDKIVILSPAAASFDQFKNFEKRGDEFKRLCKKYA